MRPDGRTGGRPGLSAPLALAMVALVVYASLYPFTGWRWPPGLGVPDVLTLPWPSIRLPHDVWTNLLGYLPLGLLGAAAGLRSRAPRAGWWAAGVLGPALLSYAAEVAQQFLPMRVPSLLDWTLNTAGAALGAVLAWPLVRSGWVARGYGRAAGLFDADSRGGLLLIGLWPLALLFPTPVALGVGDIGPQLREAALALLDGVPWAEPWFVDLSTRRAPAVPMGLIGHSAITALGLLSPCLVAYSMVRPGWRRLLLAAVALALTAAMLTLSTGLTLGPERALAWQAPGTWPALAAGTLGAALLAGVPRRAAAALGLVALTALVALVAQVSADPYVALSQRAWEQGRFIRFHGLAPWIGWCWPYAAMAWLLLRLARPATGRAGAQT